MKCHSIAMDPAPTPQVKCPPRARAGPELGDTECESRSSCRALVLDLENLAFEPQASIALCDGHILRRPLQDGVLNYNRSSPRIAQIQNTVGRARAYARARHLATHRLPGGAGAPARVNMHTPLSGSRGAGPGAAHAAAPPGPRGRPLYISHRVPGRGARRTPPARRPLP